MILRFAGLGESSLAACGEPYVFPHLSRYGDLTLAGHGCCGHGTSSPYPGGGDHG